MTKDELISFFERDLNKLIVEIEAYKSEENLWKVNKEVTNSSGNLALHIIGNLHTFIGKELGKTDYIRQRDLEFSQQNVKRETLITHLNETKEMVKASLSSMTIESLRKDYPLLKFDKVESIEFLLVHLIAHLNYHLGQINYHRRLLDYQH